MIKITNLYYYSCHFHGKHNSCTFSNSCMINLETSHLLWEITNYHHITLVILHIMLMLKLLQIFHFGLKAKNALI